MEVLIGITGKDFTLLAASNAIMRGVTIINSKDNKTRDLNSSSLLAFSGEAGDTVQFAEFMTRNTALDGLRLGFDLGPKAVSNHIRTRLAEALRSRNPYTVNLLIGGWDAIEKKPRLYWIDYLAAREELPYAAHGYAQYYCLSILDKHHQPDCSFERGLELLSMCSDELKRRLPIDFKGFEVKVVDAKGIRVVDFEQANDRIVKSA